MNFIQFIQIIELRQVGEPKKVLEPLEERNLSVLPLCHFAHLLLFFEHTTVSLPSDFLAPFGENGLPSKSHNRHFLLYLKKNLRNKAKPGLGIYEYFPISFRFFFLQEKKLFAFPSLRYVKANEAKDDHHGPK